MKWREHYEAIFYDQYGSPDVLALKDVEKPQVKDNEVLVQIHAVSLNPYDWHFLRGLLYPMRLMPGLRKPRKATILGSDVAGRVVAVGTHVTRFHPADAVSAEVGVGACAECIAVSEAKLALKATIVSLFVRQQGGTYMATPKHGDLLELKELIEQGKLTPIIDMMYPLSDFPAAMSHLNNGHAQGKVVITLGDAT